MVLTWSGFCHTDHFHGNGHKLCTFLNFASKTTKRKRVNALAFARKLPKRLIFYRAYNKNEKTENSRSEFNYPEDLETSNVKTQSGIGEIREVIDDFIKKQKSANTNTKMATY